MSILVLADLHEGQLASATAHVVAAAQAIGGDIDVLVAGEGVQAAADAAANSGTFCRMPRRSSGAVARRTSRSWSSSSGASSP